MTLATELRRAEFLLANTLTDAEAPDRFEFQCELNAQLSTRPVDAILIEGHVVRWDIRDQHGEAFKRGAFTESLRLSRHGYGVLMHDEHEERWPVGKWHRLVEDHVGLFCRGAIYPRLASEKLKASLFAANPTRGLSPGFFRRDRPSLWNPGLIRNVWLTEISLVREPALTQATFEIV